MNEEINYKYLKKKPYMPGVNGLLDLGFLEKLHGRRDASENQICALESGHTTPHIDARVSAYDSYVDKTYLRTARNLTPTVAEVNSLVVEFNLLKSRKERTISGSGEEADRQAAAESSKASRREKRKREILTRLAEIRGESDMINESLLHHVERAEGILRARVSRYWRGVLASSTGNLEHFPYLEHREFSGRQAYLVNRSMLIEMITNAIRNGGGENEEENFAETR